MTKDKITLQFIWGVALFLAGIGMFFRIPQLMPQIKAIPQFADVIGFIYFCLYLLGYCSLAAASKNCQIPIKNTQN